jgi:hypothetical protein
MIDLGLKATDKNRALALLSKPHWIRIRIMVLNMDHDPISDLSDRLLAGQINFDTSQEPSRTLELTLSDPSGTITLNPDSPEDGALFMDRMIRVVYSIAPPDRSEWFNIPVFTGPVTGLKRDSFEVVVNAAGKEALALSNVWKPRSFKRGNRITMIMNYVLLEILGEDRADLPQTKRTTNKEVNVSSQKVPWKVLKSLASTLSRKAFYDGRGIFRARRVSKKSVYTFTEAELLSEPKFSYDPSTIINRVIVVGGKPKGAKKKVRAEAVAPANHPLSPWRLGRKIKIKDEMAWQGQEGEGVDTRRIPRYYTKTIEDSSLKSKAACKRIAQRELEVGLLQSVNMEFTALPNPFLEEYDLYRIKTPDISVQATATQWSLPLTHDGTMSVGVIRKVSFGRKRKKKKVKAPNMGWAGTSEWENGGKPRGR